MNPYPTACLLTATCLLAACAPPDSGRPDLEAHAYLRVVAAEDARPAGGRDLDVLLEATRHARPSLRAAGVRALGRLENPALVTPIEELLADAEPAVRAAAANALAQAVHRGRGDPVVRPLLRRAHRESDPEVQGVVARSLGRLSLTGEARREVGSALLASSHGPEGGWVPVAQTLGVVLGMESYVRRSREAPSGALVARLRELAGFPGEGAEAARVREVALLTLGARGLLLPDDAARGLDDPDPRVRRAAATGLGRMTPALADVLAVRAMDDAQPRVRAAGVRVVGAWPPDVSRCARLLSAAIGDPDTAVRLVALDALGRPCPTPANQVRALVTTAEGLPHPPSLAWHDAAHALAALAAVAPGRATGLLPRFADYPDPFVRTWAARAAQVVGAGSTLRSLSRDVDANVRAAALEGLSRAAPGPATDSILTTVLARDDAPQVILAAAPGLHEVQDSSLRAKALAAGLTTLQRLSRSGAETTRDPRVALLDMVEALGDASSVDGLEPYLRDYDPVVARRAAEVMESWTGKSYLAAPRRAPRLPLPTPSELQAMGESTLVLHMLHGGDVEIRLWPHVATTNAFRLHRMVRDHTLDGLTFHRVVPNFVIQGGSPGANEYAGHGAFTRDEVGLPVQWRGTVGVSTRGRDTGDGQIYVNLVDNVRLDHDYTLLGEVSAGMDVVDAVREGDVIRSTEIRRNH